MRFLALGDSYTIGEAVSEPERWPLQLAERLQRDGLEIDSTEIIATTGWTTDELRDGIAAAAPGGPYDLVSLLIGVNDQYRGHPIEEYRERFRELLGTATVLAGGRPGHVLVLSIPDWGVTQFAEGRDRTRVGREIDAFNAVNRDETAMAGARYVDVTAVSRRAATEPRMLADDGLHPSGVMYGAWTELALPVAKEALLGA